MRTKRSIPAWTAAALALAVTGCTTVKLDPSAQDVEVLRAERVQDCKRLGQTRVSVAENVGFIARGDRAIRNDLEKLARNSAAEMGGDTITPATEVQNGKQSFGVYDCID